MRHEIDTPLGVVTIEVPEDANVDASLSVVPAETSEPGVTLWTATCRFAARKPTREKHVSELVVTASLAAVPDADGGPDSGEWLDAVTFENDAAVVSVGGPDADRLRAHAGKDLPDRWAPLFDDTGEFGASYPDDHSVRWRLPGLDAGQTAALTIAVAWAAPNDDVRTWTAVNLPWTTPGRTTPGRTGS